MSGCLSRSSYKLSNKNNIVNEEYHSIDLLEKKNIVSSHYNTIITDKNNIIINNNNNKINSLRRTSSSADMSTEKWVQNNGISVIKRVHSSEIMQSLGEKNDYINEDIMNNDIDNKGSGSGAAFEDIWSSILSGKKSVEAGSGDPAPYVHPLVKRASSLSEKSLEICTESLGSETGSDGFSIPLTDPPGDGQEGEEVCGDEEEVVKKIDDVVADVVGEKYNYNNYNNNNNVINNKKTNVGVERSFPPPLPSLVNCDGGSNLHMRTRRHSGRVVVEAVAISTPQCFRARREDGRLLLTFTGDNSKEIEQEPKLESEPELDVEPEPEQNSDELVEKVNESSAMSWAPRVISVTIQAPKKMPMNKLIELTCNKSQSMWPRASNMTYVKSLENEHEVKDSSRQRQKVVAHSLPPRPRVNTTITTSTTLNEYEYYWRNRSNSPTATTAAVTVFKPLAAKQNNYYVDSVSPQVVKENNKRMNKFLIENNEKGGEQEKVVLVGEGEYLVPFFKGYCKEPRRSLFFWEPYCIATS